MSDIAISCENLSKKYRIGQRESYKALRETLTDAFSAPFRRLRGRANNNNGSVNAPNETFWALKDVSFNVRHGEVVGIIGRNGAGKSTLLKILSRITKPTDGQVKIKGRVGSLLEVGTGFHPELTGRENIFLNGTILGMKKREIERKFDEIVAFAEIEKFLDMPVKRYSSGMYVRLAFAVAAHLEPEILIVDEVLAVGDAAFQTKCLGKMNDVAKHGRTVMFVSHNMSAIADLCTKAVMLDEGKVIRQGLINEVIPLYLNQNKSNEISFHDKALRRANVYQVNQSIVIKVEYKIDCEIDLPCLGFVISDYLGNPICGSNPIIDRIPYTGVRTNAGQIEVVVEQPLLLDGVYRLSLWFGDGWEAHQIEKDCLVFDVINMTNSKQLSTAVVGPVSPKCSWTFN